MLQEEMDQRLIKLSRRMGKENASQLLSVLGKDKAFLQALDTSVGQELVKDIVTSMERIIGLMLDEKEDAKDRADLRAYKSILKRWTGRIKEYNTKHQEFLDKSS